MDPVSLQNVWPLFAGFVLMQLLLQKEACTCLCVVYAMRLQILEDVKAVLFTSCKAWGTVAESFIERKDLGVLADGWLNVASSVSGWPRRQPGLYQK